MSAWLSREWVSSLVIMGAVVLAYLWLQSPTLQTYSLQVFAVCTLTYFVLKRLQKSRLTHLAPAVLSSELALLTFAYLILVGSTGNTSSLFFAISYLHLFFLVFSTPLLTNVAVTMLIILFHLLLAQELGPLDWSNLLSLPVMLLFFIFAKQQYQLAKTGQALLAADEVALSQEADLLAEQNHFLRHFVLPKLQFLEGLLDRADRNVPVLRGQITLLSVEIEKMLQKNREVFVPAAEKPELDLLEEVASPEPVQVEVERVTITTTQVTPAQDA